MNVAELIQKLKMLDPALPVLVYDGMDPSDRTEATRLEVADYYFFRGPFVQEKGVMIL